jgi:hypothetical protein
VVLIYLVFSVTLTNMSKTQQALLKAARAPGQSRLDAYLIPRKTEKASDDPLSGSRKRRRKMIEDVDETSTVSDTRDGDMSGHFHVGIDASSKNTCNVCGTAEEEEAEFFHCEQCHTVSYCSRDHQLAHWPEHEAVCQAHVKAQVTQDPEMKNAESTAVHEATTVPKSTTMSTVEIQDGARRITCPVSGCARAKGRFGTGYDEQYFFMTHMKAHAGKEDTVAELAKQARRTWCKECKHFRPAFEAVSCDSCLKARQNQGVFRIPSEADEAQIRQWRADIEAIDKTPMSIINEIPTALRSLWSQVVQKTLLEMARAGTESEAVNAFRHWVMIKCVLVQPLRAGQQAERHRLRTWKTQMLLWLQDDQEQAWRYACQLEAKRDTQRRRQGSRKKRKTVKQESDATDKSVDDSKHAQTERVAKELGITTVLLQKRLHRA